ncbi:hypothetical protein Tco_0371870 [Tanacetum coccineum]
MIVVAFGKSLTSFYTTTLQIYVSSHVFGATRLPIDDSENFGLVPNLPPSTPFLFPARSEWEFAPEHVVSTGITFSTQLIKMHHSPTMQEELNEFERLKVWELVPPPDKALVITLKWNYKVKLDELGVDTPMMEKSKLDEDKEGKAVDCTRCPLLDQKLTTMVGFNKIPMYCDNKELLPIAATKFKHSRSKHIDIRFHFIKEHVENGVIELYFVNTEYQLAHLFTKVLARKNWNF